jgi:uncharacterized membrane protein YhiD involved in acid resistance
MPRAPVCPRFGALGRACWLCAICAGVIAPVAVDAQGLPALPAEPIAMQSFWRDLTEAAARLPLAGLLGTLLALRPRRRGTPARSMPVIETQIILSIVGALIMLVVGASLARAFGIVGAANLIRYRAKIDDPKDAVVMLAALAVGLACGVGLYALAVIGTAFVGSALWIIEGFEPEAQKSFDLTLKFTAEHAQVLRPRAEAVLRRFRARYELRTAAEDTVSFAVEAPASMSVDRVSEALVALEPSGSVAVEWDEKKAKKAS